MKFFFGKWLKRLWALLAIKLFIIATCLTLVRILFISIEDYKEYVTNWLASEYKINVSLDNISAGIDFAGLVLTLNNTKLIDSEEQPISFSAEYLFLHLDFWNSVTQKQLNFNKITLKGVELSINEAQKSENNSTESSLTIETLQHVFLYQFQQFSVADGRIHFKNKLGLNKTIVIEKLHWLNAKNKHQGVGSASLTDSLSGKPLQFVIDLSSQTKGQDGPYKGQLYAEADNLDIRDYLNQRVNPNAQISEAVFGFQLWADFSLEKLHQVQVKLNKSHFAWSQAEKNYDWKINSGSLQLTNDQQAWLLDSYDINVEHDQHLITDLAVTGLATVNNATFDLSGINLKDLLPIYLLTSDLTEQEIFEVGQFDIDGELKHVGLEIGLDNKIRFDLSLNTFKNKPVDAIPGISNANIRLTGDAQQGLISIGLTEQELYFDGQFNRSMPIESAQLAVQWRATANGVTLSSEQSVLKTADLDTITEFSLFIPNKQSSNQDLFLSLYSYASLNDASKAPHYFPIKALGDDVFDYLQPTIKKGHVNGAKILWYGALSDYPYQQHDGIFQAWVPLRDAQYDFYGNWQGLTDLDLNLLFENDWLTMDALKASLGDVKVANLSAKIDHLSPDGVLTIDADIKDSVKKISDYLKRSPLKDSVGNALHIIELNNSLSGNLKLSIPFNAEQITKTIGEITLSDNNIDIHLSDDLVIPLKKVQGKFAFINGNLNAKNLTAQLFNQPVQFSFNSTEKKDKYQVNVDLTGEWDSERLTETFTAITPLNVSGLVEWSGNLNFEYLYSGTYKYQTYLSSATQGLKIDLPDPFNKNPLQSWPLTLTLSGDKNASEFTLKIEDKLDFAGKFSYQEKTLTMPYFALNIGSQKLTDIDPNKHIINVTLDQLDITPWYQQWAALTSKTTDSAVSNEAAIVKLNAVNINVQHALFFEQPISELQIKSINHDNQWSVDIDADNLQGVIEYRLGIPERIDMNFNKIEFKEINFYSNTEQQVSTKKKASPLSDNLLADYPEVFVKCNICFIANLNLSPLDLHVYPTKSRLNIDYLKVGTETEFTTVSGVWDQRRTNMIIDSLGNNKQNIEKRFGVASPIVYQKAEVTGAINWIGAPWEFNYETLNGVVSLQLNNGSITEVSDKGARVLSLFSLDGIRRSLNLEFNNVFAKGFNFNTFTLSANIGNGIIKNDDFYLAGSAGKIVGHGLIDLPNQDINYKFSYSPAVTSSLPVLTAFAINPITGAAVLVLSKIFEPVVDTVVRVDYSVKGPINDPQVKLVSSEKGQVKLQNSKVLDEINEERLIHERGQP